MAVVQHVQCSARDSFCGKFEDGSFNLKANGGDKLDKRVDDSNFINQLNKDVKEIRENEYNELHCDAMLDGQGQVNLSISDFAQKAFERDHDEDLATFDGKRQVGLISVPRAIIPKDWINLDSERLDVARKEANCPRNFGKDQEEKTENLALSKMVKKAKDDPGGLEEEIDAFREAQTALAVSLCALLIHSLYLLNPSLKNKERKEIDGFAIDFETATVFVIEAKKSFGKKHKEAYKQVKVIKDYFEDWFGADICDRWVFKPIFYFGQNEANLKAFRNLCENCKDTKVAIGQEGMTNLIRTYRSGRVGQISNIDDKTRLRLVQDFQLMTKYLIFGVSATQLHSTTLSHLQRVHEYIGNVGSWPSIKLWCILTPGQLELLSKPKVILFSGWGGGKTITGIEACKRWSHKLKDQKVLVIVNTLEDTCGHTTPLLHRITKMVQDNSNIKVKQINLKNISAEDLDRETEEFQFMFIDEMHCNFIKDNKICAMIEGKFKVWIAISNFDYDLSGPDCPEEEDIKTALPQFEMEKTLDTNMRNPRHIKELVDKSDCSVDPYGATTTSVILANVNKSMKSPRNKALGLEANPQDIMKKVFDSGLKLPCVFAVMAPDDALVFSEILTHVFQLGHVVAHKWNANDQVEKQLKMWTEGKTEHVSNLLVVWKRMLNGYDTDIIISVEYGTLPGTELIPLGDVASRSTNQFIKWEHFLHFSVETCDKKEACFSLLKEEPKQNQILQRFIKRIYNEALENICAKADFKEAVERIQRSSTDFKEIEVLIQAAAKLNLCFHLISCDSGSGKQTKLCLCSGAMHANEQFCAKIVTFTYSVSGNLILMKKLNAGEQNVVKSPQTLIERFGEMDGQSDLAHSFTVHQKLDHEMETLYVTVNDGLTSQAVLSRLQSKTRMRVIYYFDPELKEIEPFITALNQHFGISKVIKIEDSNECSFIDEHIGILASNESSLIAFLEGNKFGENYLLIDFRCGFKFNELKTRFRGTYHSFLSIDDKNILRKLSSILSQNQRLFETVFMGTSQVQDDPLNGISILNDALSSHGFSVSSKNIFMVYDETEINIFIRFFIEHELCLTVNRDLEKVFGSFDFNTEDLDKAQERVHQFFQQVADLSNQSFIIITLTDNDMNFSDAFEIQPRSVQSSNSFHVLYIYDPETELNGFLRLEVIAKTSDPENKLNRLKGLDGLEKTSNDFCCKCSIL